MPETVKYTTQTCMHKHILSVQMTLWHRTEHGGSISIKQQLITDNDWIRCLKNIPISLSTKTTKGTATIALAATITGENSTNIGIFLMITTFLCQMQHTIPFPTLFFCTLKTEVVKIIAVFEIAASHIGYARVRKHVLTNA